MTQKELTTENIWIETDTWVYITAWLYQVWEEVKLIYGAKNQRSGWLRRKGLLTVKCIITHKDAGNVLCPLCMAVTWVHTSEKYKLYT